jgi:hypothetical protein
VVSLATVAAVLLGATSPASGAEQPFDPSQLGAVAVANANPPSSGRCARATSRSISGSIKGQDGRAVSTSIGFDLVDAAGHKIDLVTGCRLNNSYSSVLELNHYIGADGEPFGTPMTGHDGEFQGYVSSQFTLTHLPANAAHIYAEAYPRSFSPHCAPFLYTGVNRSTDRGITTGCLGRTVFEHYGRALRRFAPMSATLSMLLPSTPAFGGSTGAIVVRGSGITAVYARSEARDGTRLMSWGTVDERTPTAVTVLAMASHQSYSVTVTRNGRTRTRTGVRVAPGTTTSIAP